MCISTVMYGETGLTQNSIKIRKLSYEIYVELKKRNDGPARKVGFQMCMISSTILNMKNLVLHFLKFFSIRVPVSFKPSSYKQCAF